MFVFCVHVVQQISWCVRLKGSRHNSISPYKSVPTSVWFFLLFRARGRSFQFASFEVVMIIFFQFSHLFPDKRFTMRVAVSFSVAEKLWKRQRIVLVISGALPAAALARRPYTNFFFTSEAVAEQEKPFTRLKTKCLHFFLSITVDGKSRQFTQCLQK